MTANLFDDFRRTNNSPKRENELSFLFLNRTARPVFGDVRRVLEAWFRNYPTEHQEDLRNRFRARVEHNHQSAFFELFLHELLRRLGCAVVVHPQVLNSANRPDFHVTDPAGESFYLEAAVVMEYSEKEQAARARMAQVKDTINDAKSPDFFIDYEFAGRLATLPPLGKFRRKLERWLSTLSHEEISRIYASGETVSLPRFSFTHQAWKVVCTPRPKNKLRGRTDIRSGGFPPVQTGFSSVSTDIRKTVSAKARKYGNLDAPYVIAVNVMERGVDQDDILTALFGDEQVQVTIHADGRIGRTRPTRALNGAWTGHKGPKNTRVSGVLVASPVLPWSIPRAPVRLYHNPYTLHEFDSVLSVLPRATLTEGKIVWKDGETLSRLFALDEDWPGFEAQ